MRCFYVSDIHGSEVCWRKFLNAGRFYKADVLIMGGDIVGKALVPIVMETETKGRARLHSRDVKLDSADAIAAFETEVRDSGFYPLRATPEDIALLDASDEARQAGVRKGRPFRARALGRDRGGEEAGRRGGLRHAGEPRSLVHRRGAGVTPTRSPSAMSASCRSTGAR